MNDRVRRAGASFPSRPGQNLPRRRVEVIISTSSDKDSPGGEPLRSRRLGRSADPGMDFAPERTQRMTQEPAGDGP